MNNKTTEAQKLAPICQKLGSNLIGGDIIVHPNGGVLFEVFGKIEWLTRPGVCSYYSCRLLGSWEQGPMMEKTTFMNLNDTDVCQVYRRTCD